MKKTLLMLAFATLFSVPRASAQHFYQSADVGVASYMQSTEQTITRPWNTQYAICAHRDVNGTRLDMVNYSGFTAQLTSLVSPGAPSFSATYCDLPSGINVSDIQVLGDTVYFCGTCVDTTGQYGIIGWIPLPFSTARIGSIVKYHKVTTTSAIRKFVLSRKSNIKAVAIGTASAGNDAMLEISRLPTNIPSISIMDLPTQEHADDILLFNDATVVVVSRDASSWPEKICIRKSGVASVLSMTVTPFPTTSIRTRYTYGTGAAEHNLATYSTQYDSLTLLVTYVHVDSIGRFWERVRLFDVASMDNTASGEFRLLDKDEPLSMVPFSSQSASVIALQPFLNLDGIQYTMVHTVEFDTAGHLKAVGRQECPYRYFTSAARVYSKTTSSGFASPTVKMEVLMLCGGHKWYFKNRYSVNPPVFELNPTYCYPSSGVSTKQIPNLSKTSSYISGSSGVYPSSHPSLMVKGHVVTPSVGCYTHAQQ